MSRSGFTSVLILLAVIVVSCSSGNREPLLPPNDLTGVQTSPVSGNIGQTHLWGFYEVSLDIETETATVVPVRGVMFTANVVNFLNSNPAFMDVHIIDITVGSVFTNIGVDIFITHPFPGLDHFNGYDVRGIFMGDGSGILSYNPDLHYSLEGINQHMLPDPLDGDGGPDGYTRWFNFQEFSEGGMPLLSYTQGNLAPPDFDGTATLCPYRYFTDGLESEDDLWAWLDSNEPDHGVFSAGSTNSRFYFLKFLTGSGIKYSYAITANWEGPLPEHHPSNAPEAVACSVNDQSDVWYVGPNQKGGSLDLDINVWDWDSHPVSGVMEDYRIIVESTVLSTPYEFTPSDMTPIGGGDSYSTYHIEIPADNVTKTDGNECWVIVEDQNLDYTNSFGSPNLADTDPLAAFFRYDLEVSDQPPIEVSITVIVPNGGENWFIAMMHDILWESENVTGNVKIEFSMDGGSTWPITIDADTDNDGIESWVPEGGLNSTQARIKVSSVDDPLVFDISDDDFTVKYSSYPDGGWVRTWGGSAIDGNPNDIVVDPDGFVYACGVFGSTVDFDPGPGTHIVSTSGVQDCFINKLDPEGNWVWTTTWGGTANSDDRAQLIDIDHNGNLYVAYWETLNILGLQKFDSDGNPQWGWADNPRRAGNHYAYGLAVDSTGVYWAWPNSSRVTITKYDFDANIIWEVEDIQYDDNGDLKYVAMASDWANKIQVEPSGDYLWATGQLVSITGGGGAAWVGSFDTSDGELNQEFIYGVTSGGDTGSADGRSIDVDNSGHIYIIGKFTGTDVYLAPSGDTPHDSLCLPPDPNYGDDYATMFDSATGEIGAGWPKIWTATSCPEKNTDMPFAICIDQNGAAYVTGWMRSDNLMMGTTLLVRTDPTWQSGSDVYYAKINMDGSWAWAYSYGSTENLGGFDIGYNLYSRDSNVYSTGYFSNTVDFAPPGGGDGTRTSNGGCDYWVMKHKLDGSW